MLHLSNTLHQNKTIIFLVLITLCMVAILFSSTHSVSTLSFEYLLNVFAQPATLEAKIFFQLRLPQALNAFVAGAMLAVAGTIMQTLLKNPLADPYILGISGGATTGLLLAMSLQLPLFGLVTLAWLGALLTIVLVLKLSYTNTQLNRQQLLLTGVIIAAFWGALISLIVTVSDHEKTKGLLFWLLGDIPQGPFEIGNFIVFMVLMSLLLTSTRQLDILYQDDIKARTLGVNTNKLNLMLYLCASILTASAVIVTGPIGFIGLIVPHCLRLLGIHQHLGLLIGSALLGGALLSFANGLANTAFSPQRIPVGIITALIGVPIFLWILRSNQARK